MKLWRLKISRGRVYALLACLVPILSALLCLTPVCRAQQPSAAQSGVFTDPLKYVNWIPGPQNVTLENVASIYVPDGCRLTDVHGARLILANFNDAIPDDLVGIIAPTSGKWIGILEYSSVGYVNDPDVAQIDTNAVLQQVLDQMNSKGKSTVKTLNWQSQPAYDAKRHILEWSLVAAAPTSSKVLSRTAALLGRHGIFQFTIVQPFSLRDVPSLRQLAGNLAFKNGERYTDYQSGDKAAKIGVAELILGEKPAQTGGIFSNGFGSIAAWTYSGLAACLVTGGFVIVRRRNKTPHRHRRRRIDAHFPAPAIENKVSVNNVSANQLSLALKYNESNGQARPKSVSNHGNWSKPFRRKHRRRIFDYSGFYMNITKDLTRGSYPQAGATNGKSSSNGNANDHSNGQAAPNGATVDQTIKPEIANLIASQQSLIEGQRSILEQQARLLEEKSRLIEEQTAFLRAQAALDAGQPRLVKLG